jgi:predicted nucleotidyltransferase
MSSIALAEEKKLIKNIISSVADGLGVKIHKIVLFGSRARGDFREDSDWDILIITAGELETKIRRKLALEVKRKLFSRGIRSDIIVVSEKVYEEKKKYVGNVAFEADKEGVVI